MPCAIGSGYSPRAHGEPIPEPTYALSGRVPRMRWSGKPHKSGEATLVETRIHPTDRPGRQGGVISTKRIIGFLCTLGYEASLSVHKKAALQRTGATRTS
jgi:hypothetical protein